MLIPKYYLLELYLENNDTTSAVNIAMQIVNQKVKIENTRTIKAQARAGKFLKELEVNAPQADN